MITKWLHVTDSDENPWVLPIYSAVNHAVKKGACKEPVGIIFEIGIYITTRLNMLPIIIKRINTNWQLMYEETKKYDNKYTYQNGKEGYAIPINRELINSLLIDIDSFLFEVNSCCELIKIFYGEIYKLLGKELSTNDLGRGLFQILTQSGHNANWFSLLDKERNFFIHQATPYIAIDISTDNPDLLIMKENLKRFNDPEKFTRLSELDMVVKGFSQAIMILQEHLIMVCS